jgi:hypothetical protein
VSVLIRALAAAFMLLLADLFGFIARRFAWVSFKCACGANRLTYGWGAK